MGYKSYKLKADSYIVGIDEVGRGPLAGPVTVCSFAVPALLYKKIIPVGLKDSKALSPRARTEWYVYFRNLHRSGVLSYAVSSVSHTHIDRNGIASAVRRALAQSLHKLSLDEKTTHVFLDGLLRAPEEFENQETIVGGDALVPIIAAASIVAKVTRDALMQRLAIRYPDYGFERHKGYGTQEHYRALKKHGPCAIHRDSYLKKLVLA